MKGSLLTPWRVLAVQDGERTRYDVADAAGIVVCSMVPNLSYVGEVYARRIAASVNVLSRLDTAHIERWLGAEDFTTPVSDPSASELTDPGERFIEYEDEHVPRVFFDGDETGLAVPDLNKAMRRVTHAEAAR